MVLGCLYLAMCTKEDQSERYMAALRKPTFKSSDTHADGAGTFDWS